MSHRFAGPVGWGFSGDKTRGAELVGPARLLAQQALESLQGRPGNASRRRVLPDGSTIRAMVLVAAPNQPPIVRAYVWAPFAQGKRRKAYCKYRGILQADLVGETELLSLSPFAPVLPFYSEREEEYRHTEMPETHEYPTPPEGGTWLFEFQLETPEPGLDVRFYLASADGFWGDSDKLEARFQICEKTFAGWPCTLPGPFVDLNFEQTDRASKTTMSSRAFMVRLRVTDGMITFIPSVFKEADKETDLDEAYAEGWEIPLELVDINDELMTVRSVFVFDISSTGQDVILGFGSTYTEGAVAFLVVHLATKEYTFFPVSDVCKLVNKSFVKDTAPPLYVNLVGDTDWEISARTTANDVLFSELQNANEDRDQALNICYEIEDEAQRNICRTNAWNTWEDDYDTAIIKWKLVTEYSVTAVPSAPEPYPDTDFAYYSYSQIEVTETREIQRVFYMHFLPDLTVKQYYFVAEFSDFYKYEFLEHTAEGTCKVKLKDHFFTLIGDGPERYLENLGAYNTEVNAGFGAITETIKTKDQFAASHKTSVYSIEAEQLPVLILEIQGSSSGNWEQTDIIAFKRISGLDFGGIGTESLFAQGDEWGGDQNWESEVVYSYTSAAPTAFTAPELSDSGVQNFTYTAASAGNVINTSPTVDYWYEEVDVEDYLYSLNLSSMFAPMSQRVSNDVFITLRPGRGFDIEYFHMLLSEQWFSQQDMYLCNSFSFMPKAGQFIPSDATKYPMSLVIPWSPDYVDFSLDSPIQPLMGERRTLDANYKIWYVGWVEEKETEVT